MTKKTFIFQTGHGKGLAKTEILALLPNSIIDEVEDGFVVEAEIQNPIEFLANMGGIVRITEVIQSGPARMPLNFEQWVTKAITEGIVNKEGKVRFGLSMHPKSEIVLKKTLNNSKKNLKSLIGNLRFVNKDFQNLSSVQAWHEKLLAPGAIELHLFKSEEKWYLSRTVAIQNFEWYSRRDYDRPARSAANGMFPPKLAQILINLATAGENVNYIFDPFCGSGTVLQEACLMGFKTWGSDLSEKMVEDSKKNMEWLANEVKLENPPKIFLEDATKITEIPENCAIVTETWLGPALESPPTDLELSKIQREIEQLYEEFFSNLSRVAQPGTIIVFTSAYHRKGNERNFLPNLPAILEKYCEIIPLSDHERPSLFYERKNQLVSREVWKVRIKK